MSQIRSKILPFLPAHLLHHASVKQEHQSILFTKTDSQKWKKKCLLLLCVFCAPFPPVGAGRFGAGREGAVLFRSGTCRVSTADSTLMGGGGV